MLPHASQISFALPPDEFRLAAEVAGAVSRLPSGFPGAGLAGAASLLKVHARFQRRRRVRDRADGNPVDAGLGDGGARWRARPPPLASVTQWPRAMPRTAAACRASCCRRGRFRLRRRRRHVLLRGIATQLAPAFRRARRRHAADGLGHVAADRRDVVVLDEYRGRRGSCGDCARPHNARRTSRGFASRRRLFGYRRSSQTCPPTACTYRRVRVAMPDRCCMKLSAVRSAVRRPRARPDRKRMPAPAANRGGHPRRRCESTHRDRPAETRPGRAALRRSRAVARGEAGARAMAGEHGGDRRDVAVCSVLVERAVDQRDDLRVPQRKRRHFPGEMAGCSGVMRPRRPGIVVGAHSPGSTPGPAESRVTCHDRHHPLDGELRAGWRRRPGR